jgi:hypothetical protein
MIRTPLSLTKKQVIRKVNLCKNLRKKLKVGSWDYFSPRAGVFPVAYESVPSNRYLKRALYAPDSVQKIIDQINKNGGRP